MVAVDFIEEQKPVLDEETGLTRYSDLELFTYLRRAYNVLQKDRPLFSKKEELKTIKDQDEYDIYDEIIDVSSLSVETIPYKKVKISKFYEECFSQVSSNFYSIDQNKIFIHPIPKKDDLKISFSYSRVKELKSMDSELEMPILLEEALRLIFLSKALEKVPQRDNRNLSLHYLKLYKAEIKEAIRASKIRHKDIRSNFQII